MKKVLLTAIGGAFLAGSLTAFAAKLPEKGVYFGGNVGYGQVRVKDDTNSVSVKRNGFSWTIDGGYQFNPNFALEAGFNSFPDVKVDGLTIMKSNYSVYGAAKGILPFENGFNIFGKLGVAYAHRNIDLVIVNEAKSALVGYGAVGAGYAIADNTEITIQAAGTTKSGDKVPAMIQTTVGLTYHIPM
jgi:OmpA-OmpF porin, OOP family